MVQIVPGRQGFGTRFGAALGGALSESIPKEIDRYRLSSGLKQLGQQKNLTPFQQFAELSSIPGITPQMIQSAGELLKQQSMREGFRGKGESLPKTPQNQLGNIQFANLPAGKAQTKGSFSGIPTSAELETIGGPQVVPQNPLAKEFETVPPLTPAQWEDKISETWERFPNLTFGEVQNIVSQEEARRQAQPEAVQKENARLETVRKNLHDELQSQLELKLQKTGSEVYKDAIGEYLGNIKRLAEKELRENPNASINDVGNKYSNMALDLAKSKQDLLSNKNYGIEQFSPFQKEKLYDKLKRYSKTFLDAGSSEEFRDLLVDNFGMSEQGASSIAYPLSSGVSKVYEKYKPGLGLEQSPEQSRKFARDIESKITGNDNLLSIIAHAKRKNPFFDEYEFLQQINEDYLNGDLRLTKRQKRDLDEAGQFGMSWGDLYILPFFKE